MAKRGVVWGVTFESLVCWPGASAGLSLVLAHAYTESFCLVSSAGNIQEYCPEKPDCGQRPNPHGEGSWFFRIFREPDP